METTSPRLTKSAVNAEKRVRLTLSELKNESADKSGLKKQSQKRTSSLSSIEEVDETAEWDEEKTERMSIVTGMRQEIFDAVFESVYEQFLAKQTVYFVSHCSRLAWKSLIELNYQRKDKGGFRETEKELLDFEPNTSKKDCWAGCSIQERKYKLPVITESEVNISESPISIGIPIGEEDSTELTTTTIYSLDRAMRGVINKARKKPSDKFSLVPGRRELHQTFSVKAIKNEVSKRETIELPGPVLLKHKYFPSSRVKVRYAIAPGIRAQLSSHEPKVATIQLHKMKTALKAVANHN